MMLGVRPAALLCGAVVALCVACGSDSPAGGGVLPQPAVVDAFPGLKFERPTDLRNAGDSRLFVVEQAGVIRVFDPATSSPAREFLHLTSRVTSGGETGLLSLAFPADYATTGWFFVYYTAQTGAGLVARLSRFRVSSNPDSADATSEAVLIEIPERMSNHNGGGLSFGNGGNLYLGVGDEGGAGDNFNNAQDRTTLRGAVLRIDVSQNTTTAPYYGIPSDNPYAGNASGWREEIYAYGFRNPWRIFYDRATGTLWAADVGQDTWEEIDHVVAGGNYGWDCREGAHPFVPLKGQDPPAPACAGVATTVDPVFEYTHVDFNESITGGFVYRGTRNPSLRGAYIFGDYVSGRIWALRQAGATYNSELIVRAPFLISSFGLDAAGELYVVSYGAGAAIYRVVHDDAAPALRRSGKRP